MVLNRLRCLLLAASLLWSAAAGATTYTVGGVIYGLAGSGLVLTDTTGGTGTASPAAGATTFTMGTAVATGAGYTITVTTQPSSPTGSCVVSTWSATGTVGSANITNVSVYCSVAAKVFTPVSLSPWLGWPNYWAGAFAVDLYPLQRFWMRAKRTDTGAFIYWLVTGGPDATGQFSGVTTSLLGNIVVMAGPY